MFEQISCPSCSTFLKGGGDLFLLREIPQKGKLLLLINVHSYRRRTSDNFQCPKVFQTKSIFSLWIEKLFSWFISSSLPMMTESRFINPPSFPRGILPSPDFKLLIEMIIQFNVILFELFRFLPLPMRTQWKEAEGIKKFVCCLS